MLTRFLFILLIIIAWMLVVRVVKNWMAQGRQRTGRGGREISGGWELIRPIGQFVTKQLEKLRNILEIRDDTGLRTIATILEVAHRAENGPEMDPAEVRELLNEPNDAFRARLFNGDEVNVTGWLRTAADTLGDFRPELSGYETKGVILKAFKEMHQKRIFFPPDQRMRPIPNPPSPPSIDNRFTHFLEFQDSFDKDAAFQEWFGMDDEELPEGAMLPLLHLATGKSEQVEDLLYRYGARLYPAVIEYLCHPEQYTQESETLPYQTIFKLIGTWPRQYAEPLFRGAFESGWNDCAGFLPSEPWAENLVAVFADSPYGPPGRS
ncbi:uncharacterized protein METZ01_LOCUS267635 [marine metagenome]|uniref:Uncharacterized protein n=1 Tax=marine metagenome TaxID=408172 RepID=A0A382JW50_9ZZZZ